MENTVRALYTSLRLRSLEDPTLSTSRWQIEDLRTLPTEELFERLKQKEIVLEKSSFTAFANDFDTPEELSSALVQEEDDSDYVYLHVFELWRRLLPEKQSISLICDELDYQLYLYENDKLETLEPLDDAISAFYSVLEENLDQGIDPKAAFKAIQEYCAHDVASFLYDYILELLESKENSYASELVEQFYPFVPDTKWFDFLHAQILGLSDIKDAIAVIRKIMTDHSPNVLLYFDMLEYVARFSCPQLFSDIAKEILSQIDEPEDIEELVLITREFFDLHGHAEKNSRLDVVNQTPTVPEKKQLLVEVYNAL